MCKSDVCNNNDDRAERLSLIFFLKLQSPHCAANCLQHVRSGSQGIILCESRATHRALITYRSCAAWYDGTTQLFSLTVVVVCWLLNVPATCECISGTDLLSAATLRLKLQIKLSISPSHSILTSGQAVPALTL